jgi:hypothetical protein
MPKKRTDDFAHLPLEEQQAEIDRYQGRKVVRAANRELAAQIYSWLEDRPVTPEEFGAFMQRFEAAGHRGQYHESPSQTTARRVLSQAAALPHILQRLQDAPVDYSAALELSYVYDRILVMQQTLIDEGSGTMEEAMILYRRVGEAIRQRVYAETGHYPEEFPVPRGRITGDEEPQQFRLRDYQPPLL